MCLLYMFKPGVDKAVQSTKLTRGSLVAEPTNADSHRNSAHSVDSFQRKGTHSQLVGGAGSSPPSPRSASVHSPMPPLSSSPPSTHSHSLSGASPLSSPPSTNTVATHSLPRSNSRPLLALQPSSPSTGHTPLLTSATNHAKPHTSEDPLAYESSLSSHPQQHSPTASMNNDTSESRPLPPPSRPVSRIGSSSLNSLPVLPPRQNSLPSPPARQNTFGRLANSPN